MEATRTRKWMSRLRLRIGLSLLIIGLIVFVLGADPGIFRLDRSPITGLLQIAVFLLGLAGICMGGYITLNSLWNGSQKTIAADIGFRLVATGYVISFASGMADVFGFGSHPFPNIPYFGPWQAVGVMIGEAIIAFGFLLLIPFPHDWKQEQDSKDQG